MNVLTVDVEDYFQVEGLGIRYDQWDTFNPRIERNVRRILEVFAKHGTRGTFFIVGWIGKRFPGLVREIQAAGHEVGCHGYAHRRLHNLTPDEFRRDLKDAVAVLTDQIHKPVQCYRAPSFSIVRSTMWAIEILAEEGFHFDSSVFPVRHDLYGIPDAERFPSWQISQHGPRVFEFPPSTIRWGNHNFGVAGGGYLRLIPYGFTRWAIRNINEVENQPAMVYFHPWEIDPGQPKLRAGCRSMFRHYMNLSKMEGKIERLLQDFRFTTLSDVCRQHRVYCAALPATPETPARIAAVTAAGKSTR
jgi:polysaccharide deacetylase family protein (PEP-CTERM system associated)